MTTLSDQQLLDEFSKNRSEAAFGELVARHVDLTYSAALRLVGDTHLAKDVTQSVFLALAQNAGQVARHPVLAGWLHRTARNVAAQTVRSEVRRRHREQEAATMNELLANTAEADWNLIAPQLDAALAELDAADHDAILLRYFEKKSAQEMAGILGISAEAAQKRVSRAVEELRRRFSKRGVGVGATALVVLISANAVQAAPAGLALTISAAATLAVSTVTGTTVAAAKAAGLTLLQKTLVASTIVALAGTSLYEAHQAGQLRSQINDLQSRLAAKDGQDRKNRAEPLPVVSNFQPEFSAKPGSNPGAITLNGPNLTQPSSAGQLMAQVAAQQKKFMEASGGATNSDLSVKSINGKTVVVYRGQEFSAGSTQGTVVTKAASVNGKDYAAAFEGGRVIWENVPGAAEGLK